MSDTLLNDNQRRHLAACFRLLVEDVAQLMGQPALPDPVRIELGAVTTCVQHIIDQFALPVAREAEPSRRVQVVAEVWMTRAHDLRAAGLRGYGAVHPQLASQLDPLIDRLQARLHDLAAMASGRTTG